MIREVILLPMAENDLAAIAAYIQTEFGATALMRFIKRVDEVYERISQSPASCRMVNDKLKTRRCVLNKNCILYFRVKKKTIEVVKIFDTRQNPQRVKGL